MRYEILHRPVPWAAHKGYGRNSYNPRWKEREIFQRLLRPQVTAKIHEGPARVHFTFCFRPPESASKKRKENMLKQLESHQTRPDVTNLIKFTEDCIKGILVADDSQHVFVSGEKFYGDVDRVVIEFIPLP